MSPSKVVRRRSGLYVPRAGAGPTDQYGIEVAADAPAAWWRFGAADAAASNVGGGVWSDSSGNGRTLVNNAGSPLAQVASLLTSPPAGDQSAHNFGSRWAAAANAAWMNTNVFTIELLYNPSSNQIFVGRWSGTVATSSWLVHRTGFNLTFLVSYGSGSTAITSSASMFNSTIYHVAATLNGTAMVLYQNGANVGTATLGGAFNATTEPMTLHAQTNGLGGNTGDADEVAFYPTVLSGARIAAHNAKK